MASLRSMGDCALPVLQVAYSSARSPHLSGPASPVYSQCAPCPSFAAAFSENAKAPDRTAKLIRFISSPQDNALTNLSPSTKVEEAPLCSIGNDFPVPPRDQ